MKRMGWSPESARSHFPRSSWNPHEYQASLSLHMPTVAAAAAAAGAAGAAGGGGVASRNMAYALGWCSSDLQSCN